MKILKIIFLFIFIIFYISISSKKNNSIEKYIGKSIWKYYGDEWKTGILPITDVDNSLKEGKDYIRTWAFTNDITINKSKLNYLEKEEALNEKQFPGYICEKITGIGKYNSEKIICHTIYGYSYLIVDNSIMGENDEEIFSYHFVNYNRFPLDLNEIFDVKIKVKKIADNYKLIPIFNVKDKDILYKSFYNNKSKKSVQYIFKNIGRIIIEPISGDLTILKDEIERKQDECVFTPNTGI